MHTESRDMKPLEHAGYDFIEASAGISEYRYRNNGLQVLHMEDAAAPVVTLMVTYRVGSRNEIPGLTGATHFLEHLMFKGSEKFNRENGRTVFTVLQ
ncbi:MAG: insulinase family protein, partial [Rhodothermales bacterium]|nr:insulinase family protein [Rhodothermales bacterium]